MLLLFRHSSLLLVAALAAIVTACSNDDSPADKTMRADGKVPVKLHISVVGNDTDTRAPEEGWVDNNATDDEMMNVWTVVAVHAEDDTESPKRFEAGDIAFIHASIPEPDKREIDDFVYLYPGKYDFYNFANMEPGYVTMQILGIGDTERYLTPVNDDGTLGTRVDFPYGFFSKLGAGFEGTLDIHGVYSLTPPPGMNIKLHDISGDTDSGVAGTTVTINGNGFDPNNFDPDNHTHNGFDSKGIPMSNYQQLTIREGTSVDLIVVRMLAKIEVQVFNNGDNDATIESISLTDITANGDDNLKLLPNYGTSPDYPNDMDFHHKDLQPNLSKYATKGNMTYKPTTGKLVAHEGHKWTDETKEEPVTFTFYVNESVAPIDNTSATTGNGSGLFYLSLGIKTGAGEDVVYTHALIDQQGSTSADNNAWHYIARNDYRVIPVILSDWLFRVEPLAFVPIAGYPAVMLSSDAQKATFKTGGLIALQPFVKKRTDANWRDFSDPEVTYSTVVMDSEDNTKVDEEASWNASITWTNTDGTKVSGKDEIIKSPFVYDKATRCFIGELNNDLSADLYKADLYKTAVTITVKLGTDPQYTYSFTCDVILDKRN